MLWNKFGRMLHVHTNHKRRGDNVSGDSPKRRDDLDPQIEKSTPAAATFSRILRGDVGAGSKVKNIDTSPALDQRPGAIRMGHTGHVKLPNSNQGPVR